MNKNLIIGLIIYAAGITTGIVGFNLFHKCPVVKTENNQSVNTNTHVTVESHRVELAGGSPAKTRYMPVSTTGNSSRTDLAGGNASLPGVYPPGNVHPGSEGEWEQRYIGETVSSWDTTTAGGFEAHVEYWHNADAFHNHFAYLEKTITKDSTSVSVNNSSSVVTVTELPRWEIGAGAGMRLIDSKMNYRFFPLIVYNKKLWFIHLSIEGQGNITFSNGGISLDPGLEAKLKVGL